MALIKLKIHNAITDNMASNRFSGTERQVREIVGNGMSVLTQSEMRRCFSSRIPSSLGPLAEKLRQLDPVKDKKEYQKTLGDYLKTTKNI